MLIYVFSFTFLTSGFSVFLCIKIAVETAFDSQKKLLYTLECKDVPPPALLVEF